MKYRESSLQLPWQNFHDSSTTFPQYIRYLRLFDTYRGRTLAYLHRRRLEIPRRLRSYCVINYVTCVVQCVMSCIFCFDQPDCKFEKLRSELRSYSVMNLRFSNVFAWFYAVTVILRRITILLSQVLSWPWPVITVDVGQHYC